MSIAAVPSEAPARPGAARKPESPSALAYAQIALGVVLITAAEVLLKVGSSRPPGIPAGEAHAFSGVSALSSGWVWAGIVCYVSSLVNWLSILRRVQLIVAFNLVSTVHVAVPLAAWLILRETISWPRALSIGLVVAGVAMLANSLARAGEKL